MSKKTNQILRLLAIVSIICVCGHAANAGDIIYVKEGAAGDGSSWASAYGLLQSALDDAVSSDEIWVAAGTYYPTTEVGGTGDRYRTFQMINGVTIYGGFPDTGDPDMDDRDPNMYKTILSGDLNDDDVGFTNNAENSYHVVTGNGTNASAILDGFTITGGNADDDSPPDYHGGGIIVYYGSPTIVNCAIVENSSSNDGRPRKTMLL